MLNRAIFPHLIIRKIKILHVVKIEFRLFWVQFFGKPGRINWDYLDYLSMECGSFRKIPGFMDYVQNCGLPCCTFLNNLKTSYFLCVQWHTCLGQRQVLGVSQLFHHVSPGDQTPVSMYEGKCQTTLRWFLFFPYVLLLPVSVKCPLIASNLLILIWAW